MEQITKRDGIYYYGKRKCKSVDDAYSLFREDYHRSLGKNVYGRLNRLGQRKERIHGFGFVFDTPDRNAERFSKFPRTKCRLMGLLGIHYIRAIGIWDYPDLPEEEFWQWYEWAFSRGSKALSLVGTNDKVGRTSKRLNVRYR